MCQISEVVKRSEGTFVCCTSSDTDFIGATSVSFFDGERCFAPQKFCVSEKYQCFGDKPIAPLIKLEEDIPENFLQRGNGVVFGF
jgi:hypothetical protein